MDKQTALEQFEDAAYMSGGLYRERIMASTKLAITTISTTGRQCLRVFANGGRSFSHKRRRSADKRNHRPL